MFATLPAIWIPHLLCTVPTSFSNPLLNIEPDTRVSDSLPRHLNRKPPLLSSSTVTTSTIASTVVTSSTTGIYGTAGNASNVKPSTLYHKSLNLLSNGVSPLLRKKPPIGQHSIVSTNSANTSDYYLPPSELVSCSPQVTSNGNNGRPIGGAGATKPLHLNSTSRLSAASANLNTALDRTQSNNNSRRQSEPNGAMLNAESMQANEFDRLQQRQEAMLESLNLDFETMLMNGGNPSSANNTNSGSVVATTGDRSVISGAHNSNTMHHHHHAHPHHMHHHHAHQIIMPHRQHLLQSNSGEYGRAGMKSVHHFGNTASSQAPSTMSTGSGNGTNGMTYKEHMYMMYDEASASNHHMLHGMQNASVNIPALHNQQHQLQQHQQQQQLQQHHQMQSSQPQSPNSHGQQQAPGNNNGHHMPTGLPPSGPGPGALAPASQIKSARNDENIYEEVDFLSLSSLRAQYADTLSLQSWKKKSTNSGKRGLGAAASSSFTRWFSTRKKGSSGGSCGALNSSISQADLHSPQMIASMVDGGPVYGEANLVSRRARAPICLPELTSGMQLTSQQLKRRMIVGSIVESENSYIASLQRLIHDFKKPLEQASPALLSANKINVIFYRLEQILQCHAIFSIALNLCVQQWDEREQIGEVFVSSFGRGMVLDLYSEFINNFTHAMETVRKASKAKNAFAQFLQQRAATSPDRLSFFGLMVKPVQRFPQFILLLDDLLKHTPADHPDRLCLQLALTQLESLADRLNERKRDSERHFAVRQLLKHYLSSSTTSSCSRYLLRMDDVLMLQLDSTSGLVTKSKCRKLYLLNDMLVCVSLPSNRLKFAVGLTDVDVLDDVAPATNSLLASSALRATKGNVKFNFFNKFSEAEHCLIFLYIYLQQNRPALQDHLKIVQYSECTANLTDCCKTWKHFLELEI